MLTFLAWLKATNPDKAEFGSLDAGTRNIITRAEYRREILCRALHSTDAARWHAASPLSAFIDDRVVVRIRPDTPHEEPTPQEATLYARTLELQEPCAEPWGGSEPDDPRRSNGALNAHLARMAEDRIRTLSDRAFLDAAILAAFTGLLSSELRQKVSVIDGAKYAKAAAILAEELLVARNKAHNPDTKNPRLS